MTIKEAWLAIAPVLGALNDGHVGLGFDDGLNAAAQRFPLIFSTDEQSKQLLIKRDRTGSIPPGSRIISIDGIPASQFLDTTLAAFGGQTPALIRWRVSAAGAWTAIALFGAKPSYQVRWVGPSETAEEVTIVTHESASHHPQTDPYTFRWIREGVGLIDYLRCEDISRFKGFLNTTFKELLSGRASSLIIDVRRNSGGDSKLNDLLWSYAQDKPFKQFGGSIEKVSSRLKRDYGHERYANLYGDKAWAAPEGTIIREFDKMIIPGPLPERFAGSVYVLISAGTFSSGMGCALAAKDYGLATLVGQETGEPANGTGELYALITPNLKLQTYLTTKLFFASKPHPNGQGVLPDVYVASGKAGTGDAVMEKTLDLISQRLSGAGSIR